MAAYTRDIYGTPLAGDDAETARKWLLDECPEALYAAYDSARELGHAEVEELDVVRGLRENGFAVSDPADMPDIARAMNDHVRRVRDNSRRRQSRKAAINWMSRPESLGYIKRVYEAAGDGPVTRKMCVGVMCEAFPD